MKNLAQVESQRRLPEEMTLMQSWRDEEELER